MKKAYYNENDPYAAAWLRNLISAGMLPVGDVDDRDIREVRPNDLHGYAQCHFFAGIGGWPYALRLALWPDNRPVWTGSCPCQPFSRVGKRKGEADKRHLWPVWFDLIKKCRPAIVFGEQVAGPLGRDWFSGVRRDLENVGYACGAADLCAAGVGAPHARQRLFWVGHTIGSGLEGQSGHGAGAGRKKANGSATKAGGPWAAREWVYCLDYTHRPLEPGTLPLADGVPARVGKTRAYGSAIVPQVAAEFIAAWQEAIGEQGVTLRDLLE